MAKYIIAILCFGEEVAGKMRGSFAVVCQENIVENFL